MCFVPAPLSLCRGFFSTVHFSPPLFFPARSLFRARSTSTCCTRNPTLGARGRVSLSVGRQPALTSRFWSRCTTLYFFSEEKHHRYAAHWPTSRCKLASEHERREKVSLMTNWLYAIKPQYRGDASGWLVSSVSHLWSTFKNFCLPSLTSNQQPWHCC